MNVDSFRITQDTLAILPAHHFECGSKIIEKKDEFLHSSFPLEIIKEIAFIMALLMKNGKHLFGIICVSDRKHSTRNQRLAALHAFFRYIKIEAPKYMELCNSILSINSKKTPVVEMNYLSIAAIKELLSIPDKSSKEGRRDLAILSLLYDSGARVQELADVLVVDLRIKEPATIRLTGKGDKTRIIPIMP